MRFMSRMAFLGSLDTLPLCPRISLSLRGADEPEQLAIPKQMPSSPVCGSSCPKRLPNAVDAAPLDARLLPAETPPVILGFMPYRYPGSSRPWIYRHV